MLGPVANDSQESKLNVLELFRREKIGGACLEALCNETKVLLAYKIDTNRGKLENRYRGVFRVIC